MSKAEAQFRKLTTPATEHTREIGFVVAVDEDVNEWIGSSTMPVRGDTYASTPIEPKPYVAKLDASGVAYGTYILTRVTDSGGRARRTLLLRFRLKIQRSGWAITIGHPFC
jgi:hypothetical protein